jgi:hypothetical protein
MRFQVIVVGLEPQAGNVRNGEVSFINLRRACGGHLLHVLGRTSEALSDR